MKLSEYLRKRSKHSNALTDLERSYYGVVDYSNGWVERYKDLEIPDSQIIICLVQVLIKDGVKANIKKNLASLLKELTLPSKKKIIRP